MGRIINLKCLTLIILDAIPVDTFPTLMAKD